MRTIGIFGGAIAVLLASTASYAASSPFDTRSGGAISVAVIGDVPYGTSPTDTSQTLAFPGLISSINQDSTISLALHVGDIHSGKQYCTQAYDRTIANLWSNFRMPLVYTPGDNEWTDCHKKGEGGGAYNAVTGQIDYVKDADGNFVDYAKGNPLDNLALVRSLFFPVPGYAFGDRKLVLSQAQVAPPPANQYVENSMWEQSHVLFVTVNIPGGSNNDSDPWYGTPVASQSQLDEIGTRTAADLAWLDRAFDQATLDGASAVVIQTQADMWDLDGKPASHIANYRPFIDKIAARTSAFRKPVILFNGDSHTYRSDNPLLPGAGCVTEGGMPGTETACPSDAYANQPNGYHVTNFHRVVVHGSTFPLEWLKLTIDPRQNAAPSPDAFGPFSWQRKAQS